MLFIWGYLTMATSLSAFILGLLIYKNLENGTGGFVLSSCLLALTTFMFGLMTAIGFDADFILYPLRIGSLSMMSFFGILYYNKHL